jgi:hypothetical protein
MGMPPWPFTSKYGTSMPTEQFLHGQFAKLLVRLQVGFALTLLVFLVSMDFFFPTDYRVQAGVHGISAILALIVGTFLTHRAYPLIRGVRIDFESLRWWVLGATLANLAGAISGNWIYMRYRGQDGPRDWILGQVPAFHNVMMEFKEFISLFPFPLMVSATFLLFYYGDGIQRRRDLTQFVGVTILISWVLLMTGFVTGLGLAKLRFV